MFDKALNREKTEEDNQWQIRPRLHADSTDSMPSAKNVLEKRSSRQSLRAKREMYRINIIFSDEIQAKHNVEPQSYDFYTSKTTGEDIISEMMPLLGESESTKNYHLIADKSDWPLYGNKKLWDIHEVRFLCLSCAEQSRIPTFTLVQADEAKRYSRMPKTSDSLPDAKVVIKIKFPQNKSHLSRISSDRLTTILRSQTSYQIPTKTY
eukprot:TRINITY_DN3727_c0_g1_i1.p1 TRINITY_DN3727_c0_g1~~TRINITY_DN3727_c0_g1_i1.p1  ORF type:complete len:208 (+),score=15.55 TRINITY_DN3727_c0_g1_i1:287-910(+)